MLTDHKYTTVIDCDSATNGEQMPEANTRVGEHPIIITLQDAIAGKGFMARITMTGRALMRREDEKWWMYGVTPAGVAASGENIEESFLHFRTQYKQILVDIAQESGMFQEFKEEVERFFNEPDADDEDARLWESALRTIRSCSNPPPEPFANLPRKSAEDHPVSITVERVDVPAGKKPFAPSDNVVDAVAKAA